MLVVHRQVIQVTSVPAANQPTNPWMHIVGEYGASCGFAEHRLIDIVDDRKCENTFF